MSSAVFHHFGVPTNAKQENEVYLDGAKVYVTDPEIHPYRVEYLRFEPDSPLHDAVKNNAHSAFMVEDLSEALKDQKVIIEPFDATDTLRVAFIQDGDAVIELMQSK